MTDTADEKPTPEQVAVSRERLAAWRAAHPLPKHPGTRDPSLMPAPLTDDEAVLRAVAGLDLAGKIESEPAYIESIDAAFWVDSDNTKLAWCTSGGWTKCGDSPAHALASVLREVRGEEARNAKFLGGLGLAATSDSAARIETLEEQLARAHEELSQFRKAEAFASRKPAAPSEELVERCANRLRELVFVEREIAGARWDEMARAVLVEASK